MTREGQTFVPRTDYYMDWVRIIDSQRDADAPRAYNITIGHDIDDAAMIDNLYVGHIRRLRDMMQEILDFDAMISAKGGAQ